jgi:hypothetical protein
MLFKFNFMLDSNEDRINRQKDACTYSLTQKLLCLFICICISKKRYPDFKLAEKICKKCTQKKFFAENFCQAIIKGDNEHILTFPHVSKSA